MVGLAEVLAAEVAVHPVKAVRLVMAVLHKMERDEAVVLRKMKGDREDSMAVSQHQRTINSIRSSRSTTHECH